MPGNFTIRAQEQSVSRRYLHHEKMLRVLHLEELITLQQYTCGLFHVRNKRQVRWTDTAISQTTGRPKSLYVGCVCALMRTRSHQQYPQKTRCCCFVLRRIIYAILPRQSNRHNASHHRPHVQNCLLCPLTKPYNAGLDAAKEGRELCAMVWFGSLRQTNDPGQRPAQASREHATCVKRSLIKIYLYLYMETLFSGSVSVLCSLFSGNCTWNVIG